MAHPDSTHLRVSLYTDLNHVLFACSKPEDRIPDVTAPRQEPVLLPRRDPAVFEFARYGPRPQNFIMTSLLFNLPVALA